MPTDTKVETPRTDAQPDDLVAYWNGPEAVYAGVPIVRADFARTLERELTTRTAELEEARKQLAAANARVFAAQQRYIVFVHDDNGKLAHEFVAEYQEVRKTFLLLVAKDEALADDFMRDFDLGIEENHEFSWHSPSSDSFINFGRQLPIEEWISIHAKK